MRNGYLAIDPGLRKTGVCLGSAEGELHAAAVVKNAIKPSDDAGRIAECVAMAHSVKEWYVAALQRIGADANTTPEIVIIEWPRILASSHQKGRKCDVDPNDLLAPAAVGAAVSALFVGCKYITLTPDVWKSQVPKDVMNARVWGRLTISEQTLVERLPRGGLSHDCLDAVGIFLHTVGRLERKRVLV